MAVRHPQSRSHSFRGYYARMALTSTDTPLRAVLYLRVSLDRYARLRASAGAEDRGSIPRQEQAGRDLIDRMGWKLTATRFDPESASQYAAKEREQWPEVLAMIEAGQCDVVVLWESSRGDRKLTTWSAFLDLCADRGTLIHIVDHDTTYDVRKPRDWEILADEGVRNARESRKTSARVRSAKQHLRRTGRPDGSITYGYRSAYDHKTGILLGREPDPEKAPHVRWAFDAYKGGASMRGVRDGLLERDPSRRWSTTAVRKMLLNPRYIALIPDGSEHHSAQWEPIVDADLFWDIRGRLDEQASSGTRPGAVKHLCSYWAAGALCGTPMRYVSATQSAQQRAGRARPFYKCRCGCVGIRADWLDGYVVALVVAYWGRREIRDELAVRAEKVSVELAGLKKRRAELEARLVEIGRDGATLPVAVVVAMTEPVQAELTDVVARITSATPASARPLLEGDGEAEVLEAWHKLGREAGVGAQRDVLRGTLQHVKVHPRGRGFHRVFDSSFVDAPYQQF